MHIIYLRNKYQKPKNPLVRWREKKYKYYNYSPKSRILGILYGRRGALPVPWSSDFLTTFQYIYIIIHV